MMRLRRFFARAPSAADRFRTLEAVVATEQADTTILLDLRNGRYYTLNPVGARVWALLSSGTSLGAVTARVQDEFDAPPTQVASDVEVFVERLTTAKLIRREG